MNNKYVTAADYHLPHPEFTPGFTSDTTSILLEKTITALVGVVAVFLLPSGSNNSDSVTQRTKPDQLIIIDRAPRVVEEVSTDSTVIPFSVHASLVSSALGLGKSDIARILGVSRPTLYSWIKGVSEPRENNHPDRLRTLGELTSEICRGTKRPLYHRFVEEPLPEQADSILKFLLAEQWDLTQLRPLLAEARRLTSARDQRLGHVTPINVNHSKQESNLLDNSIALSLE